MKRCLLVIVLLFSLNPVGAFAQGSATGCLLSDNKVYTSYTSLAGLRLYSDSPSAILSSNYCTWTSPSTVPCTVCFGTINAVGLLCIGIGSYTVNGQQGTFTMVECNLDDYTWTLGAAAGLFGVFVIRRRNKL